LGRRAEALELAASVVALGIGRADWSDALGTLFTYCEEPARALRFFEHAVNSAPKHAPYLYNLATAQRMLGQLAAAEASLDRAIALDPSDARSHYARSDLRVQTDSENHVETMVETLNTRIRTRPDEIMMCFAIAKELDDMARYREAFEYWRRGCDLQRRLFTYRVDDDVATMDKIVRCHDGPALDQGTGLGSTECVFVMGLPRSGTTLAEQILAGHSAVHGAGELPAFPGEVIRAVQRGRTQGVGKLEFVERALEVDPAALGRAYLDATRPQTGHTPVFVDKQPLNYLYAGLIARALPAARMIVMARDPMDVCFAMYRTLFTAAYPFSYDLVELAAYYSAWHRLIRHWQAVLGDRLLVVDYEDLVTDFETTVRRMLTHCCLEWEPACLSFQSQTRSVSSASAAQVRRPLYASSIGKWRPYGEWLIPLSQELERRAPTTGWRLG
jgi:tetratricopeptide (TPR) repeat protein